MKAIIWIFALALIAFAIHLASFALIPSSRGPSDRVSHAVLGIAEKVTGEHYLTEYNTEREYPQGSLHATWPGQEILIAFWSLVYLFVFSLVYSVFAWIRRSSARHKSSN
jgi:hypothetical protein